MFLSLSYISCTAPPTRNAELSRKRRGLYHGHLLPCLQAQGQIGGGIHKRGARVRDHGGIGVVALPGHAGPAHRSPDGSEGGDDARLEGVAES